MRRRSAVCPLHQALLCAALLAALTGCRHSAPTRLYVLTAAAERGTTPAPDALKHGVLAVGPVRMPRYLQQPEMLRRSPQGQLTVLERDHWAEPLETMTARILAENLAAMLELDEVVLFPWHEGARPDWRVALEVLRFDAGPGAQVTLTARYALYDSNGQALVSGRLVSATAPTAAATPGAMAQAHSRALEAFSRDLAAALAAIAADSRHREP